MSEACESLREALAEQPAQDVPEVGFGNTALDKKAENARELGLDYEPAQQEPVGRLESDPDEGHVFVPRIDGDWSMLGEDLYTSPPAQRTWAGLTTEDMATCINEPAWDLVLRKAEQILKEKNT